MRTVIVAFCLTVVALTIGGASANAEEVRCSAIRDSAMCAAEPTCWFDAAGGKGCQDGPRPASDPCVVHGSESICNTSTLNCAWNTATSSCASRAD